MPELNNPRHERFCQAYVTTGNASEAYRQAGFKSKEVDGNAGRLIVRDSISSRIAEIRAELQRKSAISREEALSFLADVIRTSADDIPKRSWIIQSCKKTTGDGWESIEVKIPDKAVALQILARFCGWEKPARLSLSADDTLSSYLLELRAKPIGGNVLELPSSYGE